MAPSNVEITKAFGIPGGRQSLAAEWSGTPFFVPLAGACDYDAPAVKIVCSSNMPYAREAFGTLGEAVVLEGRAITPEDARDAEILAIRSTTRVDRGLLEGSSAMFVGTATIGTDHMDIDYLESRGIGWCYSPGCNANSVSEYVTAALLSLATRHGFGLRGKTIGVIGVGNVGSLVVEKALALGMRVLPNDPPRERCQGSRLRQGYGGQAGVRGQELEVGFVGLEEVLAESDVVTLHVPLTHEGMDKTYHMADETFFAGMKPGCVFLNTARGPVVDAGSLVAAMQRGLVSHAVVDTWEGEPAIDPDLLGRVDLGTPHIAGYSFDGKVMGTLMVYRELCGFLGVEPKWCPDEFLPPPDVPEIEIDAAHRPDEEVLWEAVRGVYDIEEDDTRLRNTCGGMQLNDAERGARFDGLRSNYPVRREFRFTRVAAPGAAAALMNKFAGLGFHSVRGPIDGEK